jgi:cytidine kinase
MSLLAVGTLAYDDIETPQHSRKDVLGGSAMYFSVAASFFGPVELVGVVGEDFRAQDLAFLKARGVNTQGVEIVPGKTFRWGGRYASDWNSRTTLFTELNVLEHFDPKLQASQRAAQFLFLANAKPRVQLKALDQVDKPRFVMADTMNLWIDIDKPDLLRLLRRVDAVVLNEEEARMLTGEKNLLKAAGAVLGMGPRYVVLKKGEHGAFLLGSDVHFSIPAYPVDEVLDPTGAGDCFAGGFMGYVASQGQADPRTLRRAMLMGTATASFCVEGFGVESLARLDRDAIPARCDQLLSIVTV